MATLRKDGRWVARRRFQDQRISEYGKTEAEAESKVEAALLELRTISTATSNNFHEYAKAAWYPRIELLKPLSKKRYEGTYVKWIRPKLKHKNLDEIKSSDIQAIVNEMALTLSPSSASTARSVVHQILASAEADGLITRNAAKYVRVPKKKAKRVRVMDLAVARDLMDGVSGTDLAAPVFLAALLGLRRGEIAGLKWQDLDRQTGSVSIARQRQWQSGKGVIEVDLKSESSARSLRLTRILMDELDKRGNLDSQYVCTHNNKPWDPETLKETWDLKKPKYFLGWTFHDLRHGAAGLLYSLGHDILEIAAVLGHAKPDMSLTYTAETEGRRVRAIASLDAVFK